MLLNKYFKTHVYTQTFANNFCFQPKIIDTRQKGSFYFIRLKKKKKQPMKPIGTRGKKLKGWARISDDKGKKWAGGTGIKSPKLGQERAF